MISAPNSPTIKSRRETAILPSAAEFLRAHYLFQKGRFFRDVQLGQNAAHGASDVAVPMWNHSAWFGSDRPDDFSAFIRESENWHTQHNRRPVIYLTEETTDLSGDGFEKFDRETWMVRDVTVEENAHPDFAVGPATDLREFVKVFRAAFSASSPAYDQVFLHENGPSQRHLIARLGDDAVGVGTVIFDGDLACIYNVGSVPEFRGRGIGRAMTEAAIRVARNEGCRWAFLQVETGSLAERLYVKLGFQPIFTRTGYRKADWQPRETSLKESALSKALGFSGRIATDQSKERVELRTINPATTSSLKKVCEQEGISSEQIAIGLWAIQLSRYLNSFEVTFRVEGANSEFIHATVVDSTALDWIKKAVKCVQNSGNSAETTITFNQRKPLADSVCLQFNGDSVEVAYRPELFAADAIQRLAGHFGCLLDSFALNPHSKIQELEWLTPAEKKKLLELCAPGGAIVWNGESISELIEARARLTPNAPALILASASDIDKPPQLTYSELMARVAERACSLRQAGIGKGDAVGVLLPRSLEVAIAMLAIWRTGGVFVPIDAGYPKERITFMASDCALKAVVTNQTLDSHLPESMKRIFADSGEQFGPVPASASNLGDPAYVIYTSGSTGQPKGVSISHGAIAQHVVAMIRYYGISASDRHLHFSPFTFDASFEQLLPPLVAGAAVVIRDEHLWDVSEFVENISKHELTMADLPMAYWHQLAQFAFDKLAAIIPDRFRLVIAGGEAMAVDRLMQWQQGAFAKCRLVNAYGPTETTVTATAFDAAHFDFKRSSSVPIGRPLPGRSAYILDSSMQLVPTGVVGQLYLGGPLLAGGYLNRADLTRQKFVKNPFGDGRLYATGDMARWLEDGNIEFLGRVDDQVKIRGFRVEPGEIETALQKHPAVRDAVVVARDDGAGQKRLVGYVTPRNGKISEREVRQWLRVRLPEYMTPSAIIALKEFPLLPSGKVNRKALLNISTSGPSQSQSNATPKTPLELQLQLIFQRVLRCNGVAVDESFFELGGDSLQALELIVQIEKATGRRLPLETLFQTPTVQRLATELQRVANGDDWSCLVALQRSGTRPPIFLVHTTPGDVLGYGNLIHHLPSDQPCYGFQALGLKDGAEPHKTIEAMAEYYVDLLRNFQPQGPYLLGGWCFGGIVAVEMAQQLRRAGQQVEPLLLMETISVPPGAANVKYHTARLKCLFSMSPQRWRQYLRAKAKYRRQVELDNRMRFRQAGENVDPEQRRWLERLEKVYNANLAALDSYRSEPYDGKIILFNAVERDPGILPDPNYGWTGLAGEIEIHEVSGDHDTMLAEPNVTSLATVISKILFSNYASRR